MLFLLLMSYYRRVRLISEAQEVRMEGGRDNYSACLQLVMAMVRARMEVVDGMHVAQYKEVVA